MVELRVNALISVAQFVDILERSGLAARRPVQNQDCLADMLKNANLTVTAWDGPQLIGIARSVTDFAYCCYLSDLAVDRNYQRQGVGRQLIAATQERLGAEAKIILLAAPAAVDYYPRLGFDRHPQCWLLPKDRPLP